jgi:hypothetical protein
MLATPRAAANDDQEQEWIMISLEDCIAMCGLTEEEVLAIAEHEHIPEIAAAALAQYLLNVTHGPERIREMIVEDVHAAQARGDQQRVQSLLHVLHHYLTSHPEARPDSGGAQSA